MLHKLVFDTTDITTISDSANVGAHIRSSKSGALITNHSLFKTAGGFFNFLDADVTPASDSISESAHGFMTGDLIQLTTSGVLPAGLALATDYYVIRVDANNIKLASSVYNAEWNIPVDITAAAGGGTHTLTGFAQDARHLDVYSALADGKGVALTSTLIGSKQSLDVNIAEGLNVEVDIDGIYNVGTNPDPENIGIILHTRAASPGDPQQLERTTAGLVAAITAANLPNVHAIDVNSFNYAIDDVSGDASLLTRDGTSTGLNVHLAGSDIEIRTNDTANTAIANAAATLAAANVAQNIIASPLAARKWMWVYNHDNQDMYIGATGVTTANGFPVSPGALMEMRAGAAVDVEFVSAKIGHKIRTLEIS